ncbi:hypothetical protein FHT78_003883 [Rhizobium sp. BK196]|jgi:hypothetical protein|uniref:hypothetical protein n=1 Tax=unclassified Rhizobium TaxID=2613769 RepID=UPI001619B060|nr:MULTISPECIES: hypothetical protein [unclassified Rhizobium]MBB3312107.1 hypothetical protein [Rhizobium sp. BK196]MBB3459439.1 hypothetical protein [Rhizobium sp. BK377]
MIDTYEKRQRGRKGIKMPGKITMINMLWMVMITGMLTATIALYDNQKVDASKVYGPFASARTVSVLGQY